MKRELLLSIALLSAASGGCGDDDDVAVVIDDAASLTAALSGAVPGDELHVAAARIEGSFTVPAGVSLVGAGTSTILVAPADAAALSVTGGTSATRISSLAIEVDGSIGIVARGGGSVAIDGVTVTVANGLGIGAEDLTGLSVRDVIVDGAVTLESARTIVMEPMRSEAPTFGIVLVRVVTATLERVAVDGFAIAGVVAVDAMLAWNAGSSSGTRGTGLLLYGGATELDDVSLCGAIRGGGLVPSYGAVLSGGADVRTQRLTVCDGEGYGILQSEARAAHIDLVVRDMSEAGVWVQSSDAFALSGAGSLLSGNRGAGLFVIGSSNVDVADATIAETRNATRIIGAETTMVGDGVQLVDTTSAVSLTNLQLRDNERVGLLLDVGTGSTAGVTLDAITVSGTGTSLGAIAQGTTVVDGWDASVLREGELVANDAAFEGFLTKAGAISPTDLPRADGLREAGLSAIGSF